MKNNTCSHIQRQRRIWFEITKRKLIREQNKNENNDSRFILSKEDAEPYEELVVSER